MLPILFGNTAKWISISDWLSAQGIARTVPFFVLMTTDYNLDFVSRLEWQTLYGE